MAVQVRRPILIGGLSLTAGAWLINSIHPIFPELGSTAVWSALAIGSGIWWLRRRSPQSLDLTPGVSVAQSTVEQALATVESHIQFLETEIDLSLTDPSQPKTIDVAIVRLRQQLAQLTQDLDRQVVRLGVMGGRSVGKSTLFQQLQAIALPNLSLQEMTEAGGHIETQAEKQAPDLTDIDLLLFLTTGDLTSAELEQVRALVTNQHRIVLVLNKQDQILPGDRPLILNQIRHHTQALLPAEDVVAIATQPAAYKVRQYQPDGTVQERTEHPAADWAALRDRLNELLPTQTQSLIWATVLRQAKALDASIQTELNQFRRRRALPLLEQYQWIAAGAAFANPVPSLDLLATACVNTQLILDLSGIYQQRFSLDQAKTVATTLATQMVKLGFVELSTEAIAPLLKSNLLTYVAGGLLQGVSAAYLTHLAGLSLMDYFEQDVSFSTPSSATPLRLDRLVQTFKAVFQANQRTAFAQALVTQSVAKLMPETVSRPVEVEPSKRP